MPFGTLLEHEFHHHLSLSTHVCSNQIRRLLFSSPSLILFIMLSSCDLGENGGDAKGHMVMCGNFKSETKGSEWSCDDGEGPIMFTPQSSHSWLAMDLDSDVFSFSVFQFVYMTDRSVTERTRYSILRTCSPRSIVSASTSTCEL